MTMDTENKLKKAFEKIEKSENVLLICHARPDGDAISSLLAMSELMEILDKKYTPFCVDEPDRVFDYLPNFEKIKSNRNNLNFSSFDLIIVLDCGSLARTKMVEEIESRGSNQFLIEFDHHPKIDNYSDLEIREPMAAATAEVLYDFFKINKIKPNKNIANCILTGLLTDTANFLYPSTTNKTMQVASEMLVRGAKMPQIVRNTWYNKSLPAMNLWGLALSKIKINKKYNFGFTLLTLDEMKKIKDYNKVDSDIWSAISGYISNLHEVRGVLILREEEGGILKGSIRTSHSTADISKLAAALGGGGHPKSSGFILKGTIKKEGEKYFVN